MFFIIKRLTSYRKTLQISNLCSKEEFIYFEENKQQNREDMKSSQKLSLHILHEKTSSSFQFKI